MPTIANGTALAVAVAPHAGSVAMKHPNVRMSQLHRKTITPAMPKSQDARRTAPTAVSLGLPAR